MTRSRDEMGLAVLTLTHLAVGGLLGGRPIPEVAPAHSGQAMAVLTGD